MLILLYVDFMLLDVCRGYLDKIGAVITVEPAGWNVKKLSLWRDLVEKQKSQALEETDENMVAEKAEKEEDAEMAAFAACKSKIAKLEQFNVWY